VLYKNTVLAGMVLEAVVLDHNKSIGQMRVVRHCNLLLTIVFFV